MIMFYLDITIQV